MIFIEWLKVIILGIVEGITEFLPISSTGHLIVFSAWLNPQLVPPNTFEIFIQLGAVVAVILYYHRDIVEKFRTWNNPKTKKFWVNIVLASIPAGLAGLIMRLFIEELFAPPVVAASLIIGGFIILYVERPSARQIQNTTFDDITWQQALIIGVIQCIALIPGVSRSGASIIGGMRAGLDREAATQFSFFLAIPVLGGATLLEFLLKFNTITPEQRWAMIVGAIVSGIVAWIAIDLLLKYVRTHTFIPFGIYRIIAGIVILVLLAAKII